VARMCEHVSGSATALAELAVHEMDFGLDGVHQLARALSSPSSTLQVLDLFDMYVGGGPLRIGGVGEAAMFRDALKTNQHLRALKLGDVPLGIEAGAGAMHLMDTLKDATHLRELDLFHVPDLDLQRLAASCGNLTRLGLSLCCCGIGPLRLSQFLAALHAHAPNLADFDLSNNRFGNPEAVVISVHVKRSTTSLRRLALDQNDISDGGATSLFQSLVNHPTMVELSLSGNRLGGPAVVALLESLPAIHLQRLALWWDATDDRESSPAVDALIRTLAANSSLIGLTLENNLGRAYRPLIEYYLYRNRLYPWLHEHQLEASPSPVSSALWPAALERLSRKDASAAYFVMREKLALWKA
jgi:Ran GTPase-activating protein (RanGAP) involved in mRNA processing and transport